jgi:hypothetical protein
MRPASISDCAHVETQRVGGFGPPTRWCRLCGALKLGVTGWWAPKGALVACSQAGWHDVPDNAVLDIGTRTRLYARWCRMCGAFTVYVYGKDYFRGRWEPWTLPKDRYEQNTSH